MSKIVRYEFLGDWLVFWFACVTVIGIPWAILYLLRCAVCIETEMDNPEQFLSDYRAGKRRRVPPSK